MAHQLIYTSAPQGLQAGRSGYCTVAHSRDLRERLILPLEQYSNYTHLVLPGQEATVQNPTIHLYRKLTLAGTEYRILSRIVDAGADHTGRSNFLAHHLIFENDWRALPSPAVLLRDWPGWNDRWDKAPGHIDEISPDELKPLGQAGGLPTAANDAYLAKGWDTPFTTFLQDGDEKADFEWMGTRDAPDPGKRIAKLFGAGPEKQAELLKSFSGMLSAPDGDEKSLLDVFAFALGQRSHAAEQEALGQAREALEAEHEKIERLARQIEASIGETQRKVDAYRQQYEEHAASRLYQNCLQDRIKPAERSTESAKAKSQDIIGKAQAEHQAAKSQLESGQSPATGINPGYQNDLREITNKLAETNHELTGGIQEFHDKLNEQNRAEKSRLTKEREERLEEQKIRHTHRGTPVGTAADYAYSPPGPKKMSFGMVAAAIAVGVVLMVAVGLIPGLLKKTDNPINYSGTDVNKKWWSFYKYDKIDKTHEFYGYYDTLSIEPDFNDKTSPDDRIEKIKKEYAKAELRHIKWEDVGDGVYQVAISTEKHGLDYKDISGGGLVTAKEIINELRKQHENKFLTKTGKESIRIKYNKVKSLYKNPSQGDGGGQPGKPVAVDTSDDSGEISENKDLVTLQGFPQFVINGKEEKQLKRWNKVHNEAKLWVASGDYTAPEEKEAEYAKIEDQLEIWTKLIKKEVREHVGELPEKYRKVDKIKGEDVKKIDGWVAAYKMWERRKVDLAAKLKSAKLKHLTEDLTIDDINKDLDEKFRITTGETPEDYKSKIVKERNYALDLYSKKNLYEDRTVDQILARLGPPTRPASGYRAANKTKWEYEQTKTGRILILHFGSHPNLPVGAGFVVLTVELKKRTEF